MTTLFEVFKIEPPSDAQSNCKWMKTDTLAASSLLTRKC